MLKPKRISAACALFMFGYMFYGVGTMCPFSRASGQSVSYAVEKGQIKKVEGHQVWAVVA